LNIDDLQSMNPNPSPEMTENTVTQKTRKLIEFVTKKGRVPNVWVINEDNYGNDLEWNGFHLSRNWLIDTQSIATKYQLIVEADASIGDEAFALGGISNERASDLSFWDISQGFGMIESIALKEGVVEDRDQVTTVLLANEDFELLSGNGNTYTLKERLRQYQDVDIVIDGKKPLVRTILTWLGKTKMDPKEKKEVLLDTSNPIYFENISKALAKHGWTVLDFVEYHNKKQGL